MKTAEEYLHEAYQVILFNQSDKHEDVDPLFLKAMEDYANDQLHQIGIKLLKKSFEVYDPLRKEVVNVPDIVAAFDMAGIDIIENIDF